MERIKRVVKGEAPTLLETAKANELIDAVNGLRNMTIDPGDSDQIFIAGDTVAITYSGGGGGGLTTEVEIVTIHGTWTLGFENGLLVSSSET